MNIVTPDIKVGMRRSDVISILSHCYSGLKTVGDEIRINAAGIVLVFTFNFLTSIEKM